MSMDAIVTGQKYVDYNSKKPKIVLVAFL